MNKDRYAGVAAGCGAAITCCLAHVTIVSGGVGAVGWLANLPLLGGAAAAVTAVVAALMLRQRRKNTTALPAARRDEPGQSPHETKVVLRCDARREGS